MSEPMTHHSEPAREAVARALIANLATVVRVQNGNRHNDINALLAQADAVLAPSTSAATRGEPVAWVQPGYLSMLQKCGSCSMRAEPIEAMDYVVPIYASPPAPAVESAQVKVRRDDPFRPAVDVDADDDYYPAREDD